MLLRCGNAESRPPGGEQKATLLVRFWSFQIRCSRYNNFFKPASARSLPLPSQAIAVADMLKCGFLVSGGGKGVVWGGGKGFVWGGNRMLHDGSQWLDSSNVRVLFFYI